MLAEDRGLTRARSSQLGRPGDRQAPGPASRSWVVPFPGVVQARELLTLSAPEPVVRAAVDAYKSLRALRDAVGGGQGPTEYELLLQAYGDHLQDLRDAIRKDLQVTGLSVKIPL